MKALLIDDLRSPLPDFAREHDFAIVRTSQEALDLLSTHPVFDAVFFDHDLGGDDTTRRVATFLREQDFLGQKVQVGEYYIHTANPVGGKWLTMELNGLGTRRYSPITIRPGDYFIQ